MKKILSGVLSVIMLVVLCVPAFAVSITSPGSGSTLVKTDLSGIDANGYFSVTIPASPKLRWGETKAIDLHYTVESHLKRDKRLNVSVEASGNLKTADGKYKLAYKLNDGGATGFKATTPVVYPEDDCPLNLTIAKSVWDRAVVETYTDTLTFNVSIANA